MYTMCMLGAHSDQKKKFEPIDMILLMVVSYVSVENQTRFLCSVRITSTLNRLVISVDLTLTFFLSTLF